MNCYVINKRNEVDEQHAESVVQQTTGYRLSTVTIIG